MNETAVATIKAKICGTCGNGTDGYSCGQYGCPFPAKLTALATGPTDAQFAADLKKRVQDALEVVAALCREGQDHGMSVNFQVGNNGYGRASVQDVSVSKLLA